MSRKGSYFNEERIHGTPRKFLRFHRGVEGERKRERKTAGKEERNGERMRGWMERERVREREIEKDGEGERQTLEKFIKTSVYISEG